MNNLGDIISRYSRSTGPKVEYEFQQLGLEMQEWFPRVGKDKRNKDIDQWKIIWTIFHRKGFTESLIRDAFLECKKRKVKGIGYLIAIVNNKLT